MATKKVRPRLDPTNARGRLSARRRSVVAAGLVGLVVCGFAVRLVDLQVVSASENLTSRSALSGLDVTRTLYGIRGAILDSTGEVLASSTMKYTAQFDPSIIDDVTLSDGEGVSRVVTWEDAAADIATIVGKTPEEVTAIVDDAVAANPSSQYALLSNSLSTEQYRKLLDLRLPYLAFSGEQSRTYPNGAVAGNVLGFVNADGPAAGLEVAENACLQPTDGTLTYSQGNEGLTIPGTEREVPAVDGGTVTTTIDADLQFYLQQMLAEEVGIQRAQRGQAMVVEVATGAVRAAAEFPTVDPNDPSASAAEDRGARIFSNPFEPGSTFKPITAASLIDSGAATPLSTTIASSHERFPNGAVVGDAFVHPANNYTLTGALIDSSNVALSHFGELASDQTRYDYLKAFGVTTKTDINFPGEEAGQLPDVASWDAQTHYATTFGQGFTTTMPQVVNAYQTIANGGVREPLHLVESCTLPDGTVKKPTLSEPRRVISESTAHSVMQMVASVGAEGDLADEVAIPGYQIGIKTGTAQKSNGMGGYKVGVFFTSIVGVLPVNDPQYIVMITLDEPTRVTSSAATAPALRKAMMQVIRTFRVMPTEDPIATLPKFGG